MLTINVTKCNNCGEIIASDYWECPICGSDLARQKAELFFQEYLMVRERKSYSTAKQYAYIVKKEGFFDFESEEKMNQVKNSINDCESSRIKVALKAYVRYLLNEKDED